MTKYDLLLGLIIFGLVYGTLMVAFPKPADCTFCGIHPCYSATGCVGDCVCLKVNDEYMGKCVSFE